MKRLMALGLVATMAAPAYAGSADQGREEPVVQQPVMTEPVSVGRDWTGGYVGAQLGYGDVDVKNAPLGGSDPTFGIHGGYMYDFGNFVIGGEADFDRARIGLGGGNRIDNIGRLKLRAGFDAGDALIYGVGGAARATTNNLGNETGYLVGVGLDYMVTEQWSVGSEVLYHRFSNFGNTTNDVEATTISLRASFRF